MQQQQLTAEQAFNVIDGICSSYQGTRKDHQLIIQSLEVIRSLVFKQEEKVLKEDPKIETPKKKLAAKELEQDHKKEQE